MTDHISPEDLDVAAALSAAADVGISDAGDDAVAEVSLQGVLNDIQNLAKSSAASAEAGELVSLAKSAAAAAAEAASLMEKNDSAIARIEKSLAALTEAVSILCAAAPAAAAKPLIVKSITTVDASPLDAAPAPAALTKSMVMDRAIAAMMATDDQSRLVELRSGIAKLESNFHPAHIAAELRLS